MEDPVLLVTVGEPLGATGEQLTFQAAAAAGCAAIQLHVKIPCGGLRVPAGGSAAAVPAATSVPTSTDVTTAAKTILRDI